MAAQSSDPDCLFCKIIAGTIPSRKVYEDEHVFAFLDIAPCTHGHTLVIPKKHSKDFTAMSPEDVTAVFTAAQKIGKAVQAALEVDAFNLVMNTGANSGQMVFHSHVHIIPRKEKKEFPLWHGQSYPSNEVADGVLEKIKGNL